MLNAFAMNSTFKGNGVPRTANKNNNKKDSNCMFVCCYHVTHKFGTLSKELLPQSRHHIRSLVGLAEWLSVQLRTKWLWVRIPLLSKLF